jgi:phosphatidylinositol kinase/protein kinase (PI-3  family)
MRVLRENKESLMAVLEAFVHDPLISWRLLTPNTKDEANGNNKSKTISFDDTDALNSSMKRDGKAKIQGKFKKNFIANEEINVNTVAAGGYSVDIDLYYNLQET